MQRRAPATGQLSDPSAPTGHPAVHWRSLYHLNLFRFTLALAALAHAVADLPWLVLEAHRLFGLTAGVYLALTLLFAVGLYWRRPGFRQQLSIHAIADIVCLTLLMHAAGGIATGLGLLLLLPIAAAGMIGVGRFVLLQAALATTGVLVEHGIRVLWLAGDPARFLHAGLLSLGFFTMAWASHILSRKASTSEQLAETRGEQLEILAGINRQIIQELQDGVMIVDETGRMLQSNLRAQALLGVDLAYGTPLQRIDPGLASRLAAWREQSPEHNQPFRAAATQRSLRPRFMSADRTHADYAVILLEDTGDIEQQAAQLKLAALGRLTASIAHEIRNPLSAITHASQLLREPDVPNTPRLLEIIEDNALRMDVLVQDVLNLSRRDRANPEAIPCKAYLQHFIEEFAAYEKVPDHGIRLDAAAGRTLSFDRAHLHQILWNLLRNAWRHCRRQAGSIRVHAAPAHTPGMIQIDVMDDGPGVPVELQSQLFEPFFTTESRGTGLGLYIARELAAANQATIEYVEHSPGGHFRLIAREVT